MFSSFFGPTWNYLNKEESESWETDNTLVHSETWYNVKSNATLKFYFHKNLKHMILLDPYNSKDSMFIYHHTSTLLSVQAHKRSIEDQEIIDDDTAIY